MASTSSDVKLPPPLRKGISLSTSTAAPSPKNGCATTSLLDVYLGRIECRTESPAIVAGVSPVPLLVNAGGER
uniref:Predicted protein n=1 Tax=Hordeum vulgare subsp. vulgare TaxID=112509 RepID=F2D099_HORVV|nr:predicted protein [Hordeum vulgare subsp. vulgare]